MITTILQPFGWFLLKIYQFFEFIGAPGSYAIALVIFTVLVKFVLFPLSYRGKKSMIKMSSLQEKMKKLEAQYGKDRQRYQEEVQKLYQKEHVRPMGGCLWSLLPLPIMMGLYMIIRRPMLYMMWIPEEAIETAIDSVSSLVNFTGNSYYNELQLAARLGDSNILATVQAAIPEYANRLTHINFNLFGIDLSQTPKLMFWKNFSELGVWQSIGLFLIPLAVTALNFWYTRYSQKTNAVLTAPEEVSNTKKNKKNKNDKPAMTSSERSNQIMMWIMPLMYLYFGYIMPAGMCVYMAVNALCTVAQDSICVRVMRKSVVQMREEQRKREEEEAAELAAKKAAIAERRRQQEEANKANAKKKKSKKQTKPVKQEVSNSSKAGRIGIRTYALGRNYDPERFGGVTAYRDPQEIIDEQAVEKALNDKRGRRKEAVKEEIARAEEAGDLERLEALEKEAAALEEAAEEAEENEDGIALGAGEADSVSKSNAAKTAPKNNDTPKGEKKKEERHSSDGEISKSEDSDDIGD